MTPIVKKIRRGKAWLTCVQYCVSLGLIVGLGGVSPVWAGEACPATGIEWEQQAMEINTAYENMQEELLGAIDCATPLLQASLIRQFDRKATRWMRCLERARFLPDGTPVRVLDAALVRSQEDLIDGLVRYARACACDTDVPCEGFATIHVAFSVIEYQDGDDLILRSSFLDDDQDVPWENSLSFLSVTGGL